MFKHILVPLDDSDACEELAERAIELALESGADITFFHACADYARTNDGALVLAMAPEAYVGICTGSAETILAKAAEAARRKGVSCSTKYKVSDARCAAILEAAGEEHCDLIVLGGHQGPCQARHGAVIVKLLEQSAIPVLICAVK